MQRIHPEPSGLRSICPTCLARLVMFTPQSLQTRARPSTQRVLICSEPLATRQPPQHEPEPNDARRQHHRHPGSGVGVYSGEDAAELEREDPDEKGQRELHPLSLHMIQASRAQTSQEARITTGENPD